MVKLVLLLSIFIVCFGEVSSGGTSRPKVVNIGAIFTLSTINARVSKIAIEAAERDVNSDESILGGTKLSVSFHDSNFSGFLGIIGALRYMGSDTVAIIGPQNSVMAHVLSHLANELHVPLLSFTALDPSLTPLQYPYFVQTAPNDQYQMAAIAEMVSYFGWSEVIAIFSDDDQSRNGVTSLGDRLAERGCKISYKAALPPDPKATRNEVKDQLVKIRLMESRIIVLHTFSKTGLKVFDVAQELGMMEKGYVWIASSWLSTVLDSTSPVSPKIANSIEGALTLRPHTPNSKRKRDFISRWDKLSNGTIGLNPYGLYAYDTVWALAHALRLLLDKGVNISFSKYTNSGNLDAGGTMNLEELSIFDAGEQLLKNILATNMAGLTGPLRFRPDRAIINPAFEIINVIGNEYKKIGYWTNYSGLSVVSPETLYAKPPNRSVSNQHLDNVIWPGGTTDKPRGWVFPNNGEKLRIGVPYRVSYRDFISQVNGTDVVQGYCIDVFLAAIKLLPYAVPYKFILFGDGQQNPNYQDLANMVASGENTLTTLGRIVVLIWLFVVLIISSSYTASLTSILTVEQLISPINGIDSLIMNNEPIGYQVGSFAQNYLSEELDIPKSRLLALGSPEEYATALEQGIVAAVVDELSYIERFLSSYCKFSIRGNQFTRSGWGFAFPKDSPLAIDMSTAILALSENGELQKIHNKWLSRKACDSQGSNLPSEQLQLQSFWGLFLICGSVCVFALLMHMCLMMRKFSQQTPGVSELSRHGSSTPSERLQTFMSFIDKKEDQPVKRSKRKRKDTLPSVYEKEDEYINISKRTHMGTSQNGYNG
ncbi:hypothetical protein FEM48_Zijuj09G0150700 [Ziziphus jujuba var. spinosa]|uniref:Glutamate receptor n=1 Tax=Ziziphus jujuba var. spinosa TaxID=714518 RepID=A0A978UTP3_ZIZJJ|nr:hypothetical protein FEM48_Zijuj09G0150700 [Ziziphus jujuba var. spinosa]